MSGGAKHSSQPVTAEELRLVQDVLERMQAQGSSGVMPGSAALAALLCFEMAPVMAGMTDASKRQRDDDLLSSMAESQFSEEVGFADAGFSVVSSPVGKCAKSPQLPVVPKKPVFDEKIQLPEGITSLEEWGNTVCELQKVKSDNKTYHELTKDSEYSSYLTWIVQHGKGKGAKCEDFRNYLIFGKFVKTGVQNRKAASVGLGGPLGSDTVSNSFRVLKTIRQSSEESEGYLESAQRVIERRFWRNQKENVGAPKFSALPSKEFIGTFLLIFTVECNVVVGSPLFAGLSIGTVLFVAIQALGGISGANFNPAVSVALGCVNSMKGPGMDWKQVGMYCIVQICGGVTAAVIAAVMFGKSASLEVSSGYTLLSAGLSEFFYTFMLCFVVLNVAAAKKNKEEKGQYYALAIGFCVVAGAYGAGVISGGAFNPAVAFSLDVTSLSRGFGTCFFYALFELLGAVLAAFLFSKVRPTDFGAPMSAGKFQEQLTLVEQLSGLSEFLGVFMLVFTVSCNIMGGSTAGALSIACSLSAMIYALGDVSGGHFNPAVSCAVYLSGRDDSFTGKKAALYSVVQVVAGILAALLVVGIFSKSMAPFGAKAPYHMTQALLGELIFTFTLSYVVLCVAVSDLTKASHLFGLAIGFCVVVGGFAVGNVSGGSLNPAVSVALALSGGGFVNAIGYVMVELFAGVLAATAFGVTHQAELESPEAKKMTEA
eukprot:s943_g18.t1